MEKQLSYEKPKVKLVGEDGNAFFILGKVRKAMKEAGATQEEIDEFVSRATSSDYDNLLTVVFDYVEVY